ncbi:dynein axonemal heavy chain 3-like isoform X2 [Centruroides vittatus]|uniref:dynein axonemal heavy chain 3-like isoform X2 n=1 Tax=Centruroides vittatus TaxID=120091 RepID=UPI0035105B9A
MSNLLFGDYISKENKQMMYDEVINDDSVISLLEKYIDKYNKESKTRMDLVIFKFIVEHFSRISRILKMTKGHMLLIGVRGSGRHSVVRLSSFVKNYNLHEIKMTSNYSKLKWKNDLKKVIYKAGADDLPSTLLFNCDNLQNKMILEDINMLLATGDIPNLFGSDEKAEIIEKIQSAVRDMGLKISSTASSLHKVFTERIHQNLHIIMPMSVTTKLFRTYLRMFPSLVNCCTMDWFQTWPEDAFETITDKLLQDVKIETETYSSCMQLCKYFHQDYYKIIEQYQVHTGKNIYTSSSKYVELILTFKQLLGKKREELSAFRNRYITGLEKLNFAASQISVMQNELTNLQPQLIETSGETEKLMVKIEQDTVEVEAKKEVVAADEALANKAAAAAQAIKDDCVKDLSEAVPAMESAVAALNTLKPQDIRVIKSMKNPPLKIKMVMEAICIMKQVKPVRRMDHSGRMIDDYWSAAQKMLLGDMKFIEHLQYYNKEDIPDHIMKEIRERFIQNPEFDPDVIKNVSLACEGLCRWVKAIDIYDRVAKVVAPKKAKLAQAEKELVHQMKKLEEKKKELQNITDKLQGLNDEFAAMTKKKKELEDNIEICSRKLERAERLLGGLGGEKVHWEEIAKELLTRYNNIVVDILLSAALVVYLGNFKEEFRKEYIVKWHRACTERSIPCSEHFSIVETLGDLTQIQYWQSLGLPVDDFITENCLIANHSRKCSLIIDPHGIAKKWIESFEENLIILKITDVKLMNKIKEALKQGNPILLENVDENIDTILDPILLKQTFKSSENEFIQLNEDIIEYSPNFKMYMVTKLYDPHYSASVQDKVTILNFTPTKFGMEIRLLSIVSAKERSELEKERNNLIAKSAENKKKLKELEDRILEILSSSQGNILEDETAIRILSSSKTLSEDIIGRQKTMAAAQQEIDNACKCYLPIASCSTVIFFCIMSLASINSMYRFSLDWFLQFYIRSIEESDKTEDLEQRIDNINCCFLEIIYQNVCSSLFEQDKLLFLFLLATKLFKSRGALDEDSWNLLLINNGSPLPLIDMKSRPSWLPKHSWLQFRHLSTLSVFQSLLDDLNQHSNEWKDIYQSSDSKIYLPSKWTSLTGINKLLLLKCLGPDRLLSGIKDFVTEMLGEKFVYAPSSSLEDIYANTTPNEPVLVILSKNSNIENSIIALNERSTYRHKLDFISLGKNQELQVEKMLEEATKSGNWLILQNCHLVPHWMPILENICEEIRTSKTIHKSFRLWLTSYPFTEFPVSILINATKVANYIPNNLRDNLLASYSDIILQSDCKHEDWHRMEFTLRFFDTILHERRRYIPLGWRIPYEFTRNDLQMSLQQTQIHLIERNDYLWKTLSYVITDCSYGGLVIDKTDRHLLSNIFSSCCNREVIDANIYSFPTEKCYTFPPTFNILEHIKTFPPETAPEVLGLHCNATIIRGRREIEGLFKNICFIQAKVVNEDGFSEMIISTLVEDILEKLPSQLNVFSSNASPHHPALFREIFQYNNLIGVMKCTLREVQEVLIGRASSSEDIEDAMECLQHGKIAKLWLRLAYPTTKSLGSFVRDLCLRLDFFKRWWEENSLVDYWLSAFYFPSAFLTDCLRTYGKIMAVSIKDLRFMFASRTEISAKEVPIRGLCIVGAHWDADRKLLVELPPRTLCHSLPSIIFRIETNIPETDDHYRCPVYATGTRDEISNYISDVTLSCDGRKDHWVYRGVALLCQADEFLDEEG